MKALQIVEAAYRGTLEEQDDTIVWLTHSMRDAGADLSVLLTGNAVNYLVRGQDARGLAFGGWTQTNPPRVDGELERLIAKGVPVYAMSEDLARRGIAADSLISGVRLVTRTELPSLFEAHDAVWHW